MIGKHPPKKEKSSQNPSMTSTLLPASKGTGTSTFSKRGFQGDALDPRTAAVPLKAESRRPKLVHTGTMKLIEGSTVSLSHSAVASHSSADQFQEQPPVAASTLSAPIVKAPSSLAQRLLAETLGASAPYSTPLPTGPSSLQTSVPKLPEGTPLAQKEMDSPSDNSSRSTFNGSAATAGSEQMLIGAVPSGLKPVVLKTKGPVAAPSLKPKTAQLSLGLISLSPTADSAPLSLSNSSSQDKSMDVRPVLGTRAGSPVVRSASIDPSQRSPPPPTSSQYGYSENGGVKWNSQSSSLSATRHIQHVKLEGVSPSIARKRPHGESWGTGPGLGTQMAPPFFGAPPVPSSRPAQVSMVVCNGGYGTGNDPSSPYSQSLQTVSPGHLNATGKVLDQNSGKKAVSANAGPRATAPPPSLLLSPAQSPLHSTGPGPIRNDGCWERYSSVYTSGNGLKHSAAMSPGMYSSSFGGPSSALQFHAYGSGSSQGMDIPPTRLASTPQGASAFRTYESKPDKRPKLDSPSGVVGERSGSKSGNDPEEQSPRTGFPQSSASAPTELLNIKPIPTPLTIVAWRTARPCYELAHSNFRPKLWSASAQNFYAGQVQSLLDGQWQETGPQSYPFTAPLQGSEVISDLQEIHQAASIGNSIAPFIEFAIPPATAELLLPPPRKHLYYHKIHGAAYSLDYLMPDSDAVSPVKSENTTQIIDSTENDLQCNEIEIDESSLLTALSSDETEQMFEVELYRNDLRLAVIQRDVYERKYLSYRERFVKEVARQEEEHKMQESVLQILRQCCSNKGKQIALKRKRNGVLKDVATGLRVRAALLGQLAHDNIRLQDRMVHAGLMDGKPRRRTAVSQHDLLAAAVQRRSRQVAASKVVSLGSTVTTPAGSGQVVSLRKHDGMVQVALGWGVAWFRHDDVHTTPITVAQKQIELEKLCCSWDRLEDLLFELSRDGEQAVSQMGTEAEETRKDVPPNSASSADQTFSSESSTSCDKDEGGKLQGDHGHSSRKLSDSHLYDSDSCSEGEVDVIKEKRCRKRTVRAQESELQGKGPPLHNYFSRELRASISETEGGDLRMLLTPPRHRRNPSPEVFSSVTPNFVGSRPRTTQIQDTLQLALPFSVAQDYICGKIYPPTKVNFPKFKDKQKKKLHNVEQWTESSLQAQRMRAEIIRLRSSIKMNTESLAEMDNTIEQVQQTRTNLRERLGPEAQQIKRANSERSKTLDKKEYVEHIAPDAACADETLVEEEAGDCQGNNDLDCLQNRPPRHPQRKEATYKDNDHKVPSKKSRVKSHSCFRKNDGSL